MTAAVATASLGAFTADVAALMGFHGHFKPLIVRSDQGSAFISHFFREFLNSWQTKQTLSAVYTPQQNSHIERFWGVVFGTCRVLLAAANLPPTFHPFAVQTAVWIHNRLPRANLGNVSPFYVLTRLAPDLEYLYCFGCLCSVVLPTPRRDGDRHFADRGEYALYLGPSEVTPGHVCYLLSSRRVTVVAKIRAWEDEFPGIKGERYHWFADETPVLTHGTEGVPALPPSAPPSAPLPPPSASPMPLPAPLGAPTPATSVGGAAPSPSPASPVPPSPIPRPSFPPSSVSGGADATSGGADSATSGGASRRDTGLNGPAWAPPPPGRTTQHGRPIRASRARHPHGHFATCTHCLGDHADTPCSRAFLPAVGQAMTAFACVCVATAAMTFSSPQPAFAYYCNVHDVSPAFSSYVGERADIASVAADCALAATVVLTSELGGVDVPRSYRKALSGPHAEYWRDAIAKELGGLLALKVWTMELASTMPAGSNLMNCHYVFTVKRTATGSIEKFKARLVADGNTQKHGIDFDRIFATVVKTTTIRLVLALAAARDYNLSSIDIRQAYLQAEITEDLFMRPPPGVWPFDSQRRPLVCKLRRSLYGLKQAGREWAVLFTSFLVTWGMARSVIDPCLYTFTATTGAILWVCVYVDDALLADSNSALRDRFVTDLSARFPTEDKGELTWILNVAITRDRSARTLTMSQALYVNDLVSKYASVLDDVPVTKTYGTPMDEGTILSADDCPEVGSEAHAAMAQRRDIYMALTGGFN